MKDKILKLCRRLKKCTLDELLSLTEEKEYIVKSALTYLEKIGCVKVDNNLILFIQNPQKSNIEQKKLNIMLSYATADDVDKIIKGFCLEIVPNKLQHFVGVKRQCIAEYYAKFREIIYKNQHSELKKLFDKNPQEGRYRIFYDQYAFFYVYGDNVYLSDYYLRGKLEKKFTKPQIREFKIMYSYLSRIESHMQYEPWMDKATPNDMPNDDLKFVAEKAGMKQALMLIFLLPGLNVSIPKNALRIAL